MLLLLCKMKHQPTPLRHRLWQYRWLYFALIVLSGAAVIAHMRPHSKQPRVRQAREVDDTQPIGTFVAPNSWKFRRHQDGYDTWLFTDLFLKNDAINLISMVYVRWAMEHKSILISVPSLGIDRQPFPTWHIRDEYESSAIGVLKDERLRSMKYVDVVITFQDEARDFRLISVHSNRVSEYGMCALFHTDHHLMEMWASYWWLLGVDKFYMYYNGKQEDIPALQERAAKLKPKFFFIHWPFDYWVPDKDRPHSGQPMAVNDCFYRNRDRHDIMMMYDMVRGGGDAECWCWCRLPSRDVCCRVRLLRNTSPRMLTIAHFPLPSQDEILVFPGHADLRSFHASLRPVTWAALRSKSTWTKIDLDKLATQYNTLTIDHIAAAPLIRTDIDYRREKYAVNTSTGTGITIVNVHGVYQVETGLGTPKADGPPQTLMDESLAYHFHFVNVGRDRSRERYVDHPVEDGRAMEMVRHLMQVKGRPEKEGAVVDTSNSNGNKLQVKAVR